MHGACLGSVSVYCLQPWQARLDVFAMPQAVDRWLPSWLTSPCCALCAAAVVGQWLPMQLLPASALQLPPGCTPPLAAFFLAERLLREDPSARLVQLAAQILHHSVSCVFTCGQQQPQQQGTPETQTPQEQHGPNSAAGSTPAAVTEAQQLAYTSLVSSLVAAVVHTPDLRPAGVEVLLGLAAELARAAGKQIGTLSSSSVSDHSSSTVLCSGSSCRRLPHAAGDGRARPWGLAASLAAAAAAGAYSAHLGVAPGAAGNRSDSEASPCTGGATSSTGSRSTADASGCCAPGGGCTQAANACPASCSVCCSAAQVYTELRCLEQGIVPTRGLGSKCAAVLAKAAQQRGDSMQQLLQQLLLAVAWQHPAPCVCGNVLCGHKKGVAAAQVVRNQFGTMCGGCRAAWYCSEGCQRAAWAAHSVACKAACGGSN